MAAEAAATLPPPLSPRFMANLFVEKYYDIQHHSPDLVHCCYQDNSKLGRPEQDGSMSITTTMHDIKEKIVSLDYGNFDVKIKSVDAQESFNGGVLVLVTGDLTGKDNMVQKFSQTFFLAPQDKGYFVLNDMFRYMDNANVNQVAAEATTPQPPVSEQDVANEFVKALYQFQRYWPELVCKFYRDTSKLGRPEQDGSMSTTSTMHAINEKIISLDYGNLDMEIKSVDTQESFKGGVHALVTGYLTGKDSTVQNFSQTFFFPYDKGYYVLNDMFRWMDNANVNPSLVNDGLLVTPPEPSNQVQENHVSKESMPPVDEAVAGKDNNPPEDGDSSRVDEVPDPKGGQGGASFSSPAATQKFPSKNLDKASSTSVQGMYGPVPNMVPVDESQEIKANAANGYSIILKGLPFNATDTLLRGTFEKFGAIKSGGIQIIHYKDGYCYGFVEFEEASSVQKAIEASPVTVGSRHVSVKEKKPSYTRGSNRGRFQAGRGSGFRYEGGRGRGYYGDGRGQSFN